jgi:hypothetical protein
MGALSAEAEMQQGRARDFIWRQPMLKQLPTVALSMDQDMVGPANNQPVPQADQAPVSHAVVRVEIMQGVDYWPASPPQQAHQQDVPGMDAGDVQKSGVDLLQCSQHLPQAGYPQSFKAKAGAVNRDRRMDMDIRTVAIMRQSPGGDQMTGRLPKDAPGSSIRQVGGVLMHAKGGRQQQIAPRPYRHVRIQAGNI